MQDDQEEFETKSKSQVKRELHALQDIGEQLTRLNNSQLARFDLPEAVLSAIFDCQSISSYGARKRQLKYIGKLLRDVDMDDAIQRLNLLTQHKAQDAQALHKLENWRERLINEGDAALSELLTEYPEIDRQHLRQLLRSIDKETKQNQPPKSYRKLFQYLKEQLTSN
jgi:ribosome-associated protein